jgi:hypothetical protein
MSTYFCDYCRTEFDTDKPIKKEYTDYFLGPCSKNIAYCPQCGQESNEKLIPKPQKNTPASPPDYCTGDCRHCS